MTMQVSLVTLFDSTHGHRTVYLLSGTDGRGRGLQFVVADGTGAAAEVRRRLRGVLEVSAEDDSFFRPDEELWVPETLGTIPVSDDDLERFTAFFRKQQRENAFGHLVEMVG